LSKKVVDNFLRIFNVSFSHGRQMIKKWSAEHDQELHPKAKFLVTAKAYLSAPFVPNISNFFDLCLHWVSVIKTSRGG
jgi:hypothetical protein